ncbi:hypothetical protein [Streptomyces mirabilis]|uniref:hypothetical protein n=1 Tax=Streptomyces mirabilis TaxID=68239 RepID=UPI0036DDEB05
MSTSMCCPPAYTCSLKSKGIHAPGRSELPQRSPEIAIALMDTYAVETAALSLSTPGTWLGDGAEAAAMASRSTSAARNPSRTAPTGSGTSSLPAPSVPGLPLFAARPDRVRFGTDWPFAPEIAVAFFTGEYDRCPGLDTGSHHAIDRNHAHALFPRLS